MVTCGERLVARTEAKSVWLPLAVGGKVCLAVLFQCGHMRVSSTQQHPVDKPEVAFTSFASKCL